MAHQGPFGSPAPSWPVRPIGLAMIKESILRRFLFALLIVPITSLALSPSTGADGMSQPQNTGVVANAEAWRAPIVVASLQRPALSAVQRATRHSLAVNASALRVSVGQLRAEWQHVAVCEVGGNWSMTGSAFSGIGFLNTTWSAYGGTQYAPNAGQATRDQQIVIGMKVTNGWVPDQYGCSPNGW